MTRRITAVAASVLIAVAFGACGKSPEDEAHDEGKKIGQDVRALFDAVNPEAAQIAVEELRSDVGDLREDTSEKVQDQINLQAETLANAVQGLRDVQSAGAGDDVELAQAALQGSVQQIRAQADAFRSGADSVANEFWRGFEEGYDGD